LGPALLRLAGFEILARREDGRARQSVHQFGQLIQGTEGHAEGLAVLDAGRLLALPAAVDAKVAELGGKGQVVDSHRLLVGGINILGHPDAALAHRKVVFLLAGHFAGVAAGAIFVMD